MDYNNYPSNSYKNGTHASLNNSNKTEQKQTKAQKVINGTATVKKKSGLSKFASDFISEDAGSVKEFVLYDILVPSVKRAISEMFKGAIDIFLYGKTSANKPSTPTSNIAYNRLYKPQNNTYGNNGITPHQTRSTYSYDNIVLESRGDAEAVLDAMGEIIDQYGMVKVADLYDLVGVTGSYTDNNYGWTNISAAHVVRLNEGGYLIKLPRAVPIN